MLLQFHEYSLCGYCNIQTLHLYSQPWLCWPSTFKVENIIKTMLCEPHVAVWMALLAACEIHGNVEMGEPAGKQVDLEVDAQPMYSCLTFILQLETGIAIIMFNNREKKEV